MQKVLTSVCITEHFLTKEDFNTETPWNFLRKVKYFSPTTLSIPKSWHPVEKGIMFSKIMKCFFTRHKAYSAFLALQ